MTFKSLNLGEFIKAKKLADKVDDLLIGLFKDRLPEDAESNLAEAQRLWREWLSIAAESPSPEESDVSLMSLKAAQGLMADFFVRSAGMDPKSNTGKKSSTASP